MDTRDHDTKPAEDIEPGDIIVIDGRPHLVDRIEPYTHPTIGETYGIARAADGWGITLEQGARLQVAGF